MNRSARQEVNAKLASYQPHANDKTVAVLEAFVQCLPRHGARNICADILASNSDEELRRLATHLVTAVLVPSECSALLYR
jgi:UDP-N-acetylmuramate-alanine ligase